MVLTDRDRELLCDLFLHQAMSREQIQTLYFGSLTRCNTRLRRLFDGGFVRRHFLPWAPYGSQAIYSIGASAVTVVASRLEREPDEVRRHSRARKPQFLRHTLEIVEFYLRLRRAGRSCGEVELERWLPEILVRHDYDVRAPGGRWHREVFRPDAFFRLIRGERYWNYFVEIDLGNTSSGQWKSKLAHYRRYHESGLFRERFGCSSFTTLVVTSSDRREGHLRALVPDTRRDCVWFSTFERISDLGPLAPVWNDASGKTHKLS